MVSLPDISHTAALLADTTRTHILMQLLSGQALTAGELAREAAVSPQTASNHLRQLLVAGFVRVESQGRHRYFRLATREVAQLLETLSIFEYQSINPHFPKIPDSLRFARRCYDHLAGELGVLLLDELRQRQWILEQLDGLVLAPAGEKWIVSLGIDVQVLKEKRRTLLRPCLDWSERRPHLAGAIGSALLDQFLAKRWLVAGQQRELHLTILGQQSLEHIFGLRLQTALSFQTE
ncbi:ArsR/SmtB family transcription factor [Deinococcus sp.]|uniref:ArsR/SmtB family transcription factor n=1 Tax=Deinococcus sp. TaxID=47478 RepID=UPI003CC62F33